MQRGLGRLLLPFAAALDDFEDAALAFALDKAGHVVRVMGVRASEGDACE